MAVSKPAELIDSHVSLPQCQRAVDALLKYAVAAEKKREENELLPGREQHVWLMVAVKKMHPEKKLKPFKIPIAHPLVDPRTSPVCLITKDPQREYKDLLEKSGIKFISRVVGITKLKGKFKPFEARRLLLAENGLFLADERVVPLLPKLLGKRFFEAKKQPIPVSLTKKDLKTELERAISSTYMHQNQGTCTSVKVGTVSQTPAQVLANLRTALPAVVKHIPGGWDNVQSLQIKTSSSASLPVWNCALDVEEGGRWDGLVVRDAESDAEEAGDSGSEDEMEVDAAVSPKPTSPSGKKRAAEEQGGKPAKKAKAGGAEDAGKSAKKVKAEASKTGKAAGAGLPCTKKGKAAGADDSGKPAKKAQSPADEETAPKTKAAASNAPARPATPATKVASAPSKKPKSAATPVVPPPGVSDAAQAPKKRKISVMDGFPAVFDAAPSKTAKPKVAAAAPPASTSAVTDSDSGSALAKPKQGRKGKGAKAPTLLDPSAPLSASTGADAAPKKAKKSAQADAADAVPPPAPAAENGDVAGSEPPAPKAKKERARKQKRASAADFFEGAVEAEGETANPDPSPIPTRKEKRAAAVPVAAVSVTPSASTSAEKTASATAPATASEADADAAPARKPRHKKGKKVEAAAESAAVEVPAPTVEVEAAPAAPAPGISKAELKHKRSAEGGERKKGKAVKGKGPMEKAASGRSAKETLLGKKRAAA